MSTMTIEDGHTSISNEGADDAGDTVGATASEPPSEGQDPGSAVAPDGEIEAVEGYRQPGLAEGAPLAAPDTSALRDIGEASFGTPPALAEIVHGPDDRIQITNTSVYPWRVHASLLITAADNSLWLGTGWFIGPHTLMTAGHVVYIKNSGVANRDGWVKSITVMPGRNGSSLPYGSVTVSTGGLRTVSGWANTGDENFDYGGIVLPNDQMGSMTGWLGFGNYSDAELLASTGNLTGYPGDKPSGTQWFASRQIAQVNSRKVYYDIDSAGGQSGSAVYRIINGARIAVAVHAYGGAVTNSGTRIVAGVFNNMVAWKA